MPVESRDDLTSALADWDKYDPDASTDKIIRQANAVADAARGAAKRIAELEAERDAAEEKAAQWKYMSDRRGEVLQQAIDHMKANLARAETAERALAEERERHQWRTIDSAPTNGDTFLAWEGSERGPFKCWWRDDWPYDESCWMDPQDSEPAPTHWKPLDIPDATAIRSGKPDGKE